MKAKYCNEYCEDGCKSCDYSDLMEYMYPLYDDVEYLPEEEVGFG